MAFSLTCNVAKTLLRIGGVDIDVSWDNVVNAGAGSVAVDGGMITEDYLVDFTLLDWEGSAVQGATVEHYIDDGTGYVLEDTYTTDVDGKTGEQVYLWASWETTDEIKTDYQHKLVIEISGRPVMVLKNIRPTTNINVQYQPGIFDRGYRCRWNFIGD